MGRVPPPGAASDAAATASRQSARSPQIVRKTARNGQHRPTTVNDQSAAQDGFSVAAHSAKLPLGRFCKAGVRGSIPLVSTHSPGPPALDVAPLSAYRSARPLAHRLGAGRGPAPGGGALGSETIDHPAQPDAGKHTPPTSRGEGGGPPH